VEGSESWDPRPHLLRGQVIPAHPLALDARRRLDERHQRALTYYYVAAGAGGIAVGVHTTQFAIREPRHGLLAPVLELASRAADEALHDASDANDAREFIKIAGICGRTAQAMSEAALARELRYHAGLLSLGGWGDTSDAALIDHCREVASTIPLVGFYLQPAVGGRELGFAFWRAFMEIPELLAIKIAPFNRYHTLDVIRAVSDSGRRDVALYTGNDDSIVVDLLTRFPRMCTGDSEAGDESTQTRSALLNSASPNSATPASSIRMVGGLLGHWAFWTSRAVELLGEIASVRDRAELGSYWLTRAAAITDANGAVFDASNRFAGCIPGIHEILRRQGLLAGDWCLDPEECMSPGQRAEIDRVVAAYPWMTDDAFVAERLDDWLR
jgi:dihydrodipicolinate synthase/N-acetylneuraminate lyase